MKSTTTPPARHPASKMFLHAICCMIIGSFLCIQPAYAQLQGTYTIGGSNGDYASFTEAAQALEFEGISGPTTFKVRPGTYSEELVLGDIAGNTCEQPIIFIAENVPAENEPLSVSVQKIQINGADGLAFRSLSINQVDITAGSNCITFENNSISGLLNAVSGSGEQANNHHIYRNNSFSTGIRKVKEGGFNSASPDLDEGLEISGNTISITDHRSRNTYHGIELNAQRDYIINDNIIAIEDERNGIHAISLLNAWYGKEIRGNTITIKSFYGRGAGISSVNGFPERVSENRISLRSADNIQNPFGEDEIALGGGTGMVVSTGKTESGEVLIANNDISVDGYDRRSALGSLTALHIRETETPGDIIKVYHNNLFVGGYKDGYSRITEANTFVAEAVADNSLYILNNIFSKLTDGGGGYAYNILHPSSVAVSDHNLFDNFRSHGSRDDLAWGEATVSSLEEWQALTGLDANSIAGGPFARKGIKTEEVDRDIEGKLRNDPPSIGAYELDEEEDRQPLEGTYTIGGENSHYATFYEAIAALRENGISGPVTFKVRPGIYEGSISIPTFWGNSCDHPLIFEGESDSNTDVVLRPNANTSSLYTVLLNGADGITFRNMSISGRRKVFEIREGSHCITLENNILTGVTGSGSAATTIIYARSSTSVFNNHHIFRNNLLLDGNIGIEKSKDINLVQEPSLLDEGLIIDSNEFRNQQETAIFISGQKGYYINRNTITKQAGGFGISIRVSLVGEEISGNIINMSGGGTGIFATAAAAKLISENRIELSEGGIGMLIDNGRALRDDMLIANNRIEIEAREGEDSGSTQMIGLSVPEANRSVKIYHNSVRLTGYPVNGTNVAFTAGGADNSLHILNNSFVNNAAGYVIALQQPTTVVASDYNNLFQAEQDASREFGQWDQAMAESFEEWKQISGHDAHSISLNPDEDQLHSAFYQAGTPVEEVSTDLFGIPRPDPPSIGAVELEDDSPSAPLAGTYTIGGEDGDFASFSEAVAALEARGIREAVNFQVKAGAYPEFISIGEFPGNSCDRRVVFEGSTADGSQVRLINTSNPYTLQLNGADGITFRNMIISGTQTTIDILEGTNCFTLENSELRSENGIIINAVSGPGDMRSNGHGYLNNTFTGGTIGLQKINTSPWAEDAPELDEGLSIINNTFNRQDEYGIKLEAQQGFRINENSFKMEGSDTQTAISVSNSWYGEEIIGNTIEINDGGSGIITRAGAPARISENQIEILGGGTGISVSPGMTDQGEVLIANNKIQLEAYEGGFFYPSIVDMVGLRVIAINENKIKVYHNSVHNDGFAVNGINFTFGGSGDANSLYVMNNSFVNTAAGYLALFNQGDVIAEMDYNNLYHDQQGWEFSPLGETFEEWQRNTGHDIHSISVNPDENNLHEDFYQAGTFLNEVTTDLTGQQRNNPPTIGAVEIDQVPYLLGGTYTVGGSDGDYASFNEAMDALHYYGTSDSVIFKVSPGTYLEQLIIKASYHPITFAGESGDSTDVVLEYPDDYALLIKEASHYSFRNMTISGRGAVRIEAERNAMVSDISFENNFLHSIGNMAAVVGSSETTDEFTRTSIDLLSFRHNLITGGGLGMSISGGIWLDQRGGGRFMNGRGLEVSGNTFITGRSGLSVATFGDVTIKDNNLMVEGDSGSAGREGISLTSVINVGEINNNKVIVKGQNAKGIWFVGGLAPAFGSSLPEELMNNRVLLPDGGTGLGFEIVEGSNTSLIANNMIVVKGNEASVGVLLDGFVIRANFYFNSIFLYGEDSESKVLSFPDLMSANGFLGYHIHFANNIFANSAGGYTVHAQSVTMDHTTITSPWEHNAFYTNGENFAHWFGSDLASLSEWQALHGIDENSLFVNPQFESVELLIPANTLLAGAGTWLEAVPLDFFGKQRNDPPTIGAVEIEGNDPPVPLALRPFVHCVLRNQDGSYTATFGYENPNQEAVSMAIGTENRLNLLEYAGQPESFAPGRHERAFHVIFESLSTLSWTLGEETITVDLSSAPCENLVQPVEPLAGCVSEISRNIYLAQLGYHNPNDAPVAIIPGRLNSLFGPQEQGQPAVFEPGHHPEVFYASFTGNLMWGLGSERVMANSRTTPCSPALQAVQPILECVSDNGDGTYTAHFGYDNPNPVAVSAGFKLHNHLFPALPGGDEVPLTFEPGRHERVFSATFRGQRLQWRLMGHTAIARPSAALACNADNARMANVEDSLAEESPDELLVYPNFFKQQINVRFQAGESGRAIVRVYSLSGSLMTEEVSELNGTTSIQLNLQQLKQGAYILEIRTAQYNKSFRIFKE